MTEAAAGGLDSVQKAMEAVQRKMALYEGSLLQVLPLLVASGDARAALRPTVGRPGRGMAVSCSTVPRTLLRVRRPAQRALVMMQVLSALQQDSILKEVCSDGEVVCRSQRSGSCGPEPSAEHGLQQ